MIARLLLKFRYTKAEEELTSQLTHTRDPAILLTRAHLYMCLGKTQEKYNELGIKDLEEIEKQNVPHAQSTRFHAISAHRVDKTSEISLLKAKLLCQQATYQKGDQSRALYQEAYILFNTILEDKNADLHARIVAGTRIITLIRDDYYLPSKSSSSSDAKNIDEVKAITAKIIPLAVEATKDNTTHPKAHIASVIFSVHNPDKEKLASIPISLNPKNFTDDHSHHLPDYLIEDLFVTQFLYCNKASFVTTDLKSIKSYIKHMIFHLTDPSIKFNALIHALSYETFLGTVFRIPRTLGGSTNINSGSLEEIAKHFKECIGNFIIYTTPLGRKALMLSEHTIAIWQKDEKLRHELKEQHPTIHNFVEEIRIKKIARQQTQKHLDSAIKHYNNKKYEDAIADCNIVEASDDKTIKEAALALKLQACLQEHKKTEQGNITLPETLSQSDLTLESIIQSASNQVYTTTQLTATEECALLLANTHPENKEEISRRLKNLFIPEEKLTQNAEKLKNNPTNKEKLAIEQEEQRAIKKLATISIHLRFELFKHVAQKPYQEKLLLAAFSSPILEEKTTAAPAKTESKRVITKAKSESKAEPIPTLQANLALLRNPDLEAAKRKELALASRAIADQLAKTSTLANIMSLALYYHHQNDLDKTTQYCRQFIVDLKTATTSELASITPLLNNFFTMLIADSMSEASILDESKISGTIKDKIKDLIFNIPAIEVKAKVMDAIVEKRSGPLTTIFWHTRHFIMIDGATLEAGRLKEIKENLDKLKDNHGDAIAKKVLADLNPAYDALKSFDATKEKQYSDLFARDDISLPSRIQAANAFNTIQEGKPRDEHKESKETLLINTDQLVAELEKQPQTPEASAVLLGEHLKRYDAESARQHFYNLIQQISQKNSQPTFAYSRIFYLMLALSDPKTHRAIKFDFPISKFAKEQFLKWFKAIDSKRTKISLSHYLAALSPDTWIGSLFRYGTDTTLEPLNTGISKEILAVLKEKTQEAVPLLNYLDPLLETMSLVGKTKFGEELEKHAPEALKRLAVVYELHLLNWLITENYIGQAHDQSIVNINRFIQILTAHPSSASVHLDLLNRSYHKLALFHYRGKEYKLSLENLEKSPEILDEATKMKGHLLKGIIYQIQEQNDYAANAFSMAWNGTNTTMRMLAGIKLRKPKEDIKKLKQELESIKKPHPNTLCALILACIYLELEEDAIKYSKKFNSSTCQFTNADYFLQQEISGLDKKYINGIENITTEITAQQQTQKRLDSAIKHYNDKKYEDVIADCNIVETSDDKATKEAALALKLQACSQEHKKSEIGNITFSTELKLEDLTLQTVIKQITQQTSTQTVLTATEECILFLAHSHLKEDKHAEATLKKIFMEEEKRTTDPERIKKLATIPIHLQTELLKLLPENSKREELLLAVFKPTSAPEETVVVVGASQWAKESKETIATCNDVADDLSKKPFNTPSGAKVSPHQSSFLRPKFSGASEEARDELLRKSFEL